MKSLKVDMNSVNCFLLVVVLVLVVMCCMNKSNEGFYYRKKRLTQKERNCANNNRPLECFKKGGLCCDEKGECLNMCNGYHKKYGVSNLSNGFYIQKNKKIRDSCSANVHIPNISMNPWMRGRVD